MCAVSYARIQGKESLVSKFKHSRYIKFPNKEKSDAARAGVPPKVILLVRPVQRTRGGLSALLVLKIKTQSLFLVNDDGISDDHLGRVGIITGVLKVFFEALDRGFTAVLACSSVN